MGGAAAPPDADRERIDKVLAGDVVAGGVLGLTRSLPAAEVSAMPWQERSEEHLRSR